MTYSRSQDTLFLSFRPTPEAAQTTSVGMFYREPDRQPDCEAGSFFEDVSCTRGVGFAIHSRKARLGCDPSALGDLLGGGYSCQLTLNGVCSAGFSENERGTATLRTTDGGSARGITS